MSDRDSSDAALVVRVLSGDSGAFRSLVDRYHAAGARYACRMLGNREDAEDALQETFARVYRALGAYDERSTFRAWLYRILVNECRTIARRRVRHERRLGTDAGGGAGEATEERDADIRDALQRALGRIEPLLREAFLLKYGEGLDYREIAALTDASVSALKMRVKRAREAMRPELEGLFDE